jgi:hypothetical protein
MPVNRRKDFADKCARVEHRSWDNHDWQNNKAEYTWYFGRRGRPDMDGESDDMGGSNAEGVQ